LGIAYLNRSAQLNLLKLSFKAIFLQTYVVMLKDVLRYFKEYITIKEIKEVSPKTLIFYQNCLEKFATYKQLFFEALG
jgi:hypothetical protein